jgi:arginine repressor
MNISGLISGLKQNVRDRETGQAVKVANELKSLKAERVRAEGQKKIYDLRAKEKAKNMKAKSDLRLLKRESSVVGRVGLQIQKNIKESKKKGSKKKKSIGSDTFFSNNSKNAWFPK